MINMGQERTKQVLAVAVLAWIALYPAVQSEALASREGGLTMYYLPLIHIPSLVRVDHITFYAPNQY